MKLLLAGDGGLVERLSQEYAAASAHCAVSPFS